MYMHASCMYMCTFQDAIQRPVNHSEYKILMIKYILQCTVAKTSDQVICCLQSTYLERRHDGFAPYVIRRERAHVQIREQAIQVHEFGRGCRRCRRARTYPSRLRVYACECVCMYVHAHTYVHMCLYADSTLYERRAEAYAAASRLLHVHMRINVHVLQGR